MPVPAAVVEAEDLGRTFAGRRAVDGVTFALAPGESLALFGPNGAGKTTLLRLLAGLLRPTSGVARVAGTGARGHAAVRAQVGFISHHAMLYPALTARENLTLTARLYGLADPAAAALRALETLGVAHRADAPVRALSRGLQQRVSIARAIVHAPSVVLLDEPYTGLDSVGAAALTRSLGQLRGHGAALVLVTHNVAEGLAIATRAATMLRGRIVADEPTAALEHAEFAARYQGIVATDAGVA